MAFAIDNNRGRERETYQAEHFLVLHDEHTGWRELKGNGRYPNTEKTLVEIPDSTFFAFVGDAARGGVIESDANELVLAYDPLTIRLRNEAERSVFQIASGPATLRLGKRTLRGRVIHEWLHLRGRNRLAAFEIGTLRDFHGFYLQFGDGDFYFHHQAPGPLSAILGDQAGFALEGGHEASLARAAFRVVKHKWALGWYRWPVEYEIRWGGGGHLPLRVESQRVQSNWGIGGFSMGIARGTAHLGEREVPYYGLVELIR